LGVLALSDSIGGKEYHSKYFSERNKTEGQYLDGITTPYLCGRAKTKCVGVLEPILEGLVF